MARNFNLADIAVLVVEDARELAENVAGDDNTKTQMRRFYQEFVRLRQSIPKGDNAAYKKNEVALKMMIAKVAYASSRSNVKIKPEFRTWLENNIKAISNADDVHKFGDYYEAFIGFFYAAQPQNNNNNYHNNRGNNRR